MRLTLLFLFTFAFIGTALCQENDPMHVEFFEVKDHHQYIDKLEHQEWESKYEHFKIGQFNYFIPSLKIKPGAIAKIKCVIQQKFRFNSDKIVFQINDKLISLDSTLLNQDTIVFNVPSAKKDYSITVLYDNSLIGQIDVFVYPIITNHIIIVPLLETKIPIDSLKHYLDSIYIQAGVKFNIKLAPTFRSIELDTSLLSNPSSAHDRFTSEMTNIRNLYFERHPHNDNKAYYLFIVPGFNQKSIQGYMVRNKDIGFIKKNDFHNLKRVVAQQLGFGAGSLNSTWKNNGPKQGSTNNLMDKGVGTQLIHKQWEAIRSSSVSISYYDDYEDVQTNSGIIAYYFWEEDSLGNIVLTKSNLLGSIARPFKKNQYSVYLDIDNFLYFTVIKPYGILISVLHLIALVVVFVLSIIVRRKIVRKWREAFFKYWFFRFVFRFFNFFIFTCIYVLLFILIDKGYARYEVNEGALKEMNNMSLVKATTEISNNNATAKLQEKALGSELVIKKDNAWHLKKRKNVLYFTLYKDGENWSRCKYLTDSDTLAISSKNYRNAAASHYMVFNYLDSTDNLIHQRIFNHLGVDITEKLELKDPAKRILLFVNGYRPTSMSQSLEENFIDIQKNGFEFPNSNNKIYTFDRYDYWRPWHEFDLQLKKRLNPDETLYADGHFSVATSNHRSLVKFTTLASRYPKRCKDKSHHVCQTSKISDWSSFGIKTDRPTVELFNLSPNREGFEERKNGGRIAGRNLLQMFNELPNLSDNDTLYIVSHSMGYAYSLGVIEQLRGKIHFGGFYIIAAENASAGTVNPKEWQEIWQYGEDFDAEKHKAPCLLDGVAPQIKAGGLSSNHRVYIPLSNYSKKGFYNSHFIGYYTWILKLKKGETGFIKQR